MLSPIATRRARLLAAGAGVALSLGLLAGPVVAEVDEATSVTAPAPAYGTVEYEWTDPLRRLGEPEDFMGIAVYLASDSSAWMTGQALTVCGGTNMYR